jgi:hypothetical protein
MKSTWKYAVAAATLFLSVSIHSQTVPEPPPCPVKFLHINPSEVNIRVQNTGGKVIVGMQLYAALADSTEHWKWFHWDFDDDRPLRAFGWNREIKPSATKTLSWDRADLDFDRGGGGALVVDNILFADGSSWQESPDRSSCKMLWYNSHKKFFAKPIDLPPRPQVASAVP